MTRPRSLLITLSNIGDAVMTTPVLQVLHRACPDDLIDIVADRRSAAVFKHCPYLGDIYIKDKRAPLRGTWQLLRELRARRYRVAVDLRTGFLTRLLRVGRRLSSVQGRPAGMHAVQEHLGVVAGLPGEGAVPGTRIWLDDGERELARQLLGHRHGQRLLALGPGANWLPKIWPARRYLALVNRLAAKFDGLVLLGSEADAVHASVIAATAELPCIDLCGRTSLRAAAAVLAEAAFFVGNDSGLGHLASAVGTPTLTLFGVGDPARYTPWGARAANVVQPVGRLDELDVETVLTAIHAHMECCQSAAGAPG